MTGNETTGRPGRPRDAEREDAILAATREVVAESGYERLTIEAVAARARASKATIYRRWSGKAALVGDALRCRPLAMPVMPDSGDLRTDMVEGILAFVADLSEQDADLVVGLVAAMRSDPDLAAMVREQTVSCRRTAASAWLHRAVARGQIHPDADTDVVADLVPAVVFMRLLVTGEPVDEPFVSHLVDSVLLPLLTGGRTPTHV